MARVVSSVTVKRPSHALIAFAAALVRSKPAELTAREYLRLLQLHVAKGRRDHAVSHRHHHLDRSAWWRSEYEREKDAKIASESEVTDLKLEIDRLKVKLEIASPTKKRKVDEDVVPVPRSPKKAKQNEAIAKRSAGDAEAVAAFDFNGMGEVGNILMRSFYQVNAILKSNQKTEPTVLAYHCVRAASSVPQVLEQTLQNIATPTDVGFEDLKLVLTACNRAILSLVMGFNRLSHVTDGAQVQGKVAYAYVQMYAKLIDILSDTVLSECKTLINGEPSTRAENKAASSKAKSKQQSQRGNIKASPSLSLITTFLCGILRNLDPKNEAHKSLFEGFAYVVLQKLGSCLYTLTFGHRRGETMGVEIALDNIEEKSNDSDKATSEELVLKAAKLEAPCLIQLLKPIMSAAPNHVDAVTSAKTGKAKVDTTRGSTKGALAIGAKQKLQRTLVTCMFGTEGVDDDSPLMDCLKMPSIDGSALPMPKIKEAEVQDWFKEEVWRLLGWDILSKEGDW